MKMAHTEVLGNYSKQTVLADQKEATKHSVIPRESMKTVQYKYNAINPDIANARFRVYCSTKSVNSSSSIERSRPK